MSIERQKGTRHCSCQLQDALMQTLNEQQAEDGDGDASGGAALADDSDAEDVDEYGDDLPSRAGSGMTTSVSGQ